MANSSSSLSPAYKKSDCYADRASGTDDTIDKRTIMEPNNDFHKNVFMGHTHQHTKTVPCGIIRLSFNRFP